MSIIIKDLRRKAGMTQKEFAGMFSIPISTLRKWEQGESAPPAYVTKLIAGSLPSSDDSLQKISGRDGKTYYYDEERSRLTDPAGNTIRISEDLTGVKEKNLGLYVSDLFNGLYEIQGRFDRDCRYDKEEDIIWI